MNNLSLFNVITFDSATEEALKEFFVKHSASVRVNQTNVTELLKNVPVVPEAAIEIHAIFYKLYKAMQEGFVQPIVNEIALAYMYEHTLYGDGLTFIAHVTEQTRFNGCSIDVSLEYPDTTLDVKELDDFNESIGECFENYLLDVHGGLAAYVGPLMQLMLLGPAPSDKVKEALISKLEFEDMNVSFFSSKMHVTSFFQRYETDMKYFSNAPTAAYLSDCRGWGNYTHEEDEHSS